MALLSKNDGSEQEKKMETFLQSWIQSLSTVSQAVKVD